MAQFTSSELTQHFSPAASLAALGVHLRQIDLFGPIRERVKIAQKTVKYTPLDKLTDAFISILAGAQGLVEINTRLRSDVALQAAFNREACADQSVVQDTLNACKAEQVTQLESALTTIYRQHSQGYAHDYTAAWQILDADLSGMPCGKKAAFACKGYFPQQRYRRGRQLGRVLASRYHEIVVDQLFNGNTYLRSALRLLIMAAEQILDLSEEKRARTIVRVDAGGGSLSEINWLLSQGYQVHAKDYSGQRAQRLARSVRRWLDDPRIEGRQVGWVSEPTSAYTRPVRRIAVRCRKKNGQWGVGVIISTLEGADVLNLAGQGCSYRIWWLIPFSHSGRIPAPIGSAGSGNISCNSGISLLIGSRTTQSHSLCARLRSRVRRSSNCSCARCRFWNQRLCSVALCAPG